MPVFNEGKGLYTFYEKVTEVLVGLSDYQWKIVFVDDGSQDNSWQIITELADNNQHIKGLLLSRNLVIICHELS